MENINYDSNFDLFGGKKFGLPKMPKMGKMPNLSKMGHGFAETGLHIPGISDFLCMPSQIYFYLVILLCIIYLGYRMYKGTGFPSFSTLSCISSSIIIISIVLATLCVPYRIATWVLVALYVCIGICAICCT
jgi:hypothetical protein